MKTTKVLFVGILTALLSTLVTAVNDPHQWNEVWIVGDYKTISRTILSNVLPVIVAYLVKSPRETS